MKNQLDYIILSAALSLLTIFPALSQNVGIGLTTPLTSLHILEYNFDDTGTDGAVMSIQNASQNALSNSSIMSGIRFKNNAGTTDDFFSGALFFVRRGLDGRSDFVFANSNGIPNATVADHKMVLTANGNLGIGYFQPSAKVEVSGRVKMDTLQITTNAAAGRILVSNAQGKTFWQDPSSIGDNFWKLNGNALGTSDFIGSTNEASLVGKANNQSALLVDVFAENTTLGLMAGDSLDLSEISSTTRDNVFVGYAAGQLLSDGFSNVFVGSRAGEEIESGSYNVGIGHYALNNYSDVEQNTCMGFFAGLNIRGDENIAIGSSAGAGLTGGDQNENISIGNEAGRRLFVARENINLGHRSGYSNRTATGNVFIGHGAGEGLITMTGPGSPDTATGAFNVFIGHRTGRIYTSGGHNIFIGQSTGDSITTGSGNILIGDSVQLATPESDNSLNIGNTLFGDLSARKIGIGTTPLTTLHLAPVGISDGIYVEGNALQSQVDIRLDNNHFLGGHEWILRSTGGTVGTGGGKLVIRDKDVGANRIVIDSTGNVGIGTDSPGVELEVNGDICATGSIGACSDIRYKENIIPVTNITTEFDKINTVYYDWKTTEFPEKKFSDRRQLGFIAQELEQVFPELVHTDKHGFKSVDYAKMSAVLWQALKEQQDKINTLEDQFDEIQKYMLQLVAEIRKQ